jgi:hypothetical protein
MQVPNKLTVGVLDVAWVTCSGPIEVQTQLTIWMVENNIYPLVAGGSAAPFYFALPYSREDADKIIAKVKELGGEQL